RHGIDETAFPQAFKIDYVRVCQYTSSERGQQQCGNSPFTPSRERFGYSSELRDMAKPTFLRVETGASRSNERQGTCLLAKDAERVETTIPLALPDGYPTDRTVRVLLYKDRNAQPIASYQYNLSDPPEARKGPTSPEAPKGPTRMRFSLPPM